MKKAKTTATKKAVSAKAKKPATAKKKTATKKAVGSTKPKKAVVANKPKKAASPAQLRAQKKIKSVNSLAVRKIYDAGRNNRPVPTWKGVSKAAAREVFKK